MFEDTQRIERLDYNEYKKAIYYMNHPAEYPGDFTAFRDKLIDYATRLEEEKNNHPHETT